MMLLKFYLSLVCFSTCPKVDHYKALDHYLKNEREELLQIEPKERGEHFLSFQTLMGNEKTPSLEKYSFHVEETAQDRCILLYASSNGSYRERLDQLLEELFLSGYKGHILVRRGGFPDEDLELAKIPYAFKLAFLKEAKELGYKEALWIDLSLHPLTNLEMLFSEIKRNEVLFLKISSLLENISKHSIQAASNLGIDFESFKSVSHISSSIIGLNLQSKKCEKLLSLWEECTKKEKAYLTYHPDDLSLSAAFSKLNLETYTWMGNIICSEDEVSWLLEERPTIQFFTKKIE